MKTKLYGNPEPEVFRFIGRPIPISSKLAETFPEDEEEFYDAKSDFSEERATPLPTGQVVVSAEQEEMYNRYEKFLRDPDNIKKQRAYQQHMAIELRRHGEIDNEVCPYFPSHEIKQYKFLEHIISCREIYEQECLEDDGYPYEIRCGYNWNHNVNFHEIDYHHGTLCNDKLIRVPEDWKYLQMDKSNQKVRETIMELEAAEYKSDYDQKRGLHRGKNDTDLSSLDGWDYSDSASTTTTEPDSAHTTQTFTESDDLESVTTASELDMDTISTAFETTETDMDTISTDFDRTETDVDTTETDVDTIGTDVDTIGTDVDSIESDQE